jgi:glycosyltransferase involved in cell wall biosynthesis
VSSNTKSESRTADALLLDLSGDKQSALRWAESQLPDAQIQTVNKADLKWGSKREALTRIRELEPRTFAIFTADLESQSARSLMLIFAALAGAKRIIIGDNHGHTVKRSRLSALLLEFSRLAFEILIGYGFIIPLSGLLTFALGAMLRFKSILRSQNRINRPETKGRSVLYLRATISTAKEGGMLSHAGGFVRGAMSLGHKFRFVLSGSETASPDYAKDNVTIKPSNLLSATRALFEIWNNLAFTTEAMRLIEDEPDFDFIYQRYSRFNWTGVALSLAAGRPLALEYNGSEVWISKRWDPVGQLWLLDKFERLNQRAADFIFVVSEVERCNLISAGVNASKVIVNPNGVDPEIFRPDSGGREIKSKLGIEDKIVVGFLGTFGPWHGAPVLAEAATRVGASAHCHFLFIGDGDERPMTEKIIERGGVSATFVGRIPHAEAPAYLDACDILASPHVHSKDGTEFFGSPTKLFEYLSSACPVVASRLGQIADVIEDETTGLLVEPGDVEELARAIERLATDESLRKRLGEAGRRRVIEKYTWQQNAARVFDAMENLL